VCLQRRVLVHGGSHLLRGVVQRRLDVCLVHKDVRKSAGDDGVDLGVGGRRADGHGILQTGIEQLAVLRVVLSGDDLVCDGLVGGDAAGAQIALYKSVLGTPECELRGLFVVLFACDGDAADAEHRLLGGELRDLGDVGVFEVVGLVAEGRPAAEGTHGHGAVHQLLDRIDVGLGNRRVAVLIDEILQELNGLHILGAVDGRSLEIVGDDGGAVVAQPALDHEVILRNGEGIVLDAVFFIGEFFAVGQKFVLVPVFLRQLEAGLLEAGLVAVDDNVVALGRERVHIAVRERHGLQERRLEVVENLVDLVLVGVDIGVERLGDAHIAHHVEALDGHERGVHVLTRADHRLDLREILAPGAGDEHGVDLDAGFFGVLGDERVELVLVLAGAAPGQRQLLGGVAAGGGGGGSRGGRGRGGGCSGCGGHSGRGGRGRRGAGRSGRLGAGREAEQHHGSQHESKNTFHVNLPYFLVSDGVPSVVST